MTRRKKSLTTRLVPGRGEPLLTPASLVDNGSPGSSKQASELGWGMRRQDRQQPAHPPGDHS